LPLVVLTQPASVIIAKSSKYAIARLIFARTITSSIIYGLIADFPK
jgi:hypothetical protein